jgi:hypothetical protein
MPHLQRPESMMDFDEALELVTEGAVVARPGWGESEIVTRHSVAAPNGAQVICWHTTRVLSTVDVSADDWRVIGSLQ